MVKKTIKPDEIKRAWFVVDAKTEILGRLSAKISRILQGKNRSYYTPNWDMGDYVVVINAKKILVTGKKEKKKVYYRHTTYPGGLRKETLGELRERKPEALIKKAVWGMMPKNKLSKKMMKKMYIYAGDEHPHKDKELVELKTW